MVVQERGHGASRHDIERTARQAHAAEVVALFVEIACVVFHAHELRQGHDALQQPAVHALYIRRGQRVGEEGQAGAEGDAAVKIEDGVLVGIPAPVHLNLDDFGAPRAGGMNELQALGGRPGEVGARDEDGLFPGDTGDGLIERVNLLIGQAHIVGRAVGRPKISDPGGDLPLHPPAGGIKVEFFVGIECRHDGHQGTLDFFGRLDWDLHGWGGERIAACQAREPAQS